MFFGKGTTYKHTHSCTSWCFVAYVFARTLLLEERRRRERNTCIDALVNFRDKREQDICHCRWLFWSCPAGNGFSRIREKIRGLKRSEVEVCIYFSTGHIGPQYGVLSLWNTCALCVCFPKEGENDRGHRCMAVWKRCAFLFRHKHQSCQTWFFVFQSVCCAFFVIFGRRR
jgi:hypothetical protein